jgi:tRNA-dihydrouridine synthase C
MEGLGCKAFRIAMSKIGGFDWACTEFIRVSLNPCIQGLAKEYNSIETAPIPLAVQVMGSDPNHLSQMAVALEKKGAPRIDLNCGCPSNTVTGKGAGSSLLKTPDLIYKILKKMVDSVSVPVSAKLRSGFEDTSLLKENLLAAQEAGVSFVTLHPRTKEQGYGPPADWSLISKAKEILRIPVIGNGDIKTSIDAKKMLQETGCDGLMIGRGAVVNPWIFREINGDEYKVDWELFFSEYLNNLQPPQALTKLKQISNFILREDPRRKDLLRRTDITAEGYLSQLINILSTCP